ncbi:response regulator transcription factor [Brevundimonas sp.]|uniref:response regulator transcription factor n=1 Tax=Brevundimonas sp. TaxID=1871086 RepID=UPI00286B882E|nr:response regulator transcription factor [Brevundimonas sp.]
MQPPPNVEPQATVLLLDQDHALLADLGGFLERQGFDVATAVDAEEARTLLGEQDVDLMIVGSSPTMHGLQLFRALMAEHSMLTIVLSDDADLTERILALEVGADDLLQRPCNHRELLARMRALLRRATVGRHGRVSPDASWLLSSRLRTVTRPDRTVIALTPAEYTMLTDFLQKPDLLITHENSSTVLGQVLTNPKGAMRTNIVRLRRTLGDHDGSIVMTARGRGYFFAPPLVEV